MQEQSIPTPPGAAPSAAGQSPATTTVVAVQRKLGPTQMEIDYYLNDTLAAPAPTSQRFKSAAAATRQRTSENRLHELHLSTYPRPLNAKTVPNVDPPVFPSLGNAAAAAAHSDHKSGVAATTSYPPTRSTNQMFNAVVEASKASIRARPSAAVHDPLLEYAATYNQGWTETEKANVRAARGLPYDSTIQSVIGSPRTVYRYDYCKNASDRDFRTTWAGGYGEGLIPKVGSTLPSTSVSKGGVITSPRQLAKQQPLSSTREGEQMSPRVALRTVIVGEREDPEAAAKATPSFSLLDSTSSAPQRRVGSARVGEQRVPHAPTRSVHSARSRQLEVYPPQSASPRRMMRTIGSDGSGGQAEGSGYSTFSLSYFTNRAKYTANS